MYVYRRREQNSIAHSGKTQAKQIWTKDPFFCFKWVDRMIRERNVEHNHGLRKKTGVTGSSKKIMIR